jgi:formylglycine-generating enzyme required for sulfatase activity/energy-coupling factor transporter ATP-binding protein EcfA2
MTTLFISHSSKDKEWAEAVRVALRGQGYQSLFLDAHPDDGIHAGAKWERALWQRLRQSRGVVVLCTANWLGSPWCVAEAMMARERGKPVFLLAAAEIVDARQVKGAENGHPVSRIPDFLKDTQFISLADLPEREVLQRLWRGLEEEGLTVTGEFPLPERPYPGLEPFQETDAAVFFGRDDKIEEVKGVLNRRLKSNAKGFVLVLGASGCGKSSLVRAGVLPRLDPTRLGKPSTGRWVIPIPFVAARGLEGLASSLSLAFDGADPLQSIRAIRDRIKPAREAEGGLAVAVQALRELSNDLLVAHRVDEGRVLLVLDQLEEVFGATRSSDSHALLRLVLEASADNASAVVALATMRSDFLNSFQLFPGAAEQYEEITLDPMPRARFGELIEGPAQRFGLRLGAGLTERLVEDTRYDDALPLLAYTLRQLDEKCCTEPTPEGIPKRLPHGQMTLDAYADLFPPVTLDEPGGKTVRYRGVAAAIKHTADEILRDASYVGLGEGDPRLRDLRRAFYSLAQVGEAGQFTRRSALWSQMPVSCGDVLQRFVERRLLVSDKSHNGQPTLSVAHEALFRVWDTLHGWLLKDRKALALRSQIEEAAGEWDAARRAESRQWPEERILDAAGEIGRSGVSLADVESPGVVRAFLGPTDPEQLAALPALGAERDAEAGSGRYGEDWRLPLGHEARASLGVRLAILGDRRRGVGLRAGGLPDIDWCRIEGGEGTIEIRANPDDARSEVVDTLTRSVGPFSIARYPVTVAQFQAFLADCHREGAWRLPPGFPVDLPADYPPPKHRARYGNQPADTLNWWDAMAFCHWLGARLGYEVRLPMEPEWQRAATGGDPARIYPWGGDWDPRQEPWRANTVESDLGRSTAVGLYPLGASPAGLLDMAGTIYEWCLNAFDDPDDSGLPGKREDRRVLRGGSWNNNQDNARSANRNRNNPNNRNNNVGFRVLCASHIFPVLPGRGAIRCRAGGRYPTRIAAASGIVRRPRFAGRGEEGKMARVGPVRTARPGRRAYTKQGRRPELAPPVPRPSPTQTPAPSVASGPLGAQPAPQQAADLGDHGARVAVLPVAQPAPAVGEAQIDPQPTEGRIGTAQGRHPRASLPHLGLDKGLLKIQCGIHEALGSGGTVRAGETLRFRQQPFQQIEGPREDHHVLGHASAPCSTY